MNLVIYNLLILILLPVFGFRIIIKSISDKDYRRNFLQRFGYNLSPIVRTNKKVIWFHAVSLGEVIGSHGIINKLLKDFEEFSQLQLPQDIEELRKFLMMIL